MAAVQLPGYSRASELFQLLRDGKPMTRSELADATGLSRTTVGARVDELIRLGLVRAVDDAPSSGGRPSSQFSFDPRGRIVLAFSIRTDHTAVAVTDLRGATLGRDQRLLKITDGPAVVLAGAIEMSNGILQELGMSTDLVAGIGIALVGYVEILTGRQQSLPILQAWTSEEIERQFRGFLPVPVLVDNDVNVMALGEHMTHPGVDDLLFVKIAAGIGAGVIAGGELQRGASHMAGGIGHARVPRGRDVICRCGNAGCLDALASIRAMTRTLSDSGLKAGDASEIVALVEQDDPDAIQAVRQAGRDLGSVLAIYASILNPSIIAISDPIADGEDYLLSEVRKVVFAQSSPMATDVLRIVRAQPTELTALTGASQMVIEHVLAPAGIEDMLGGGMRARGAA